MIDEVYEPIPIDQLLTQAVTDKINEIKYRLEAQDYSEMDVPTAKRLLNDYCNLLTDLENGEYNG